MMKELRAWRFMEAEPFGMLMWFDPLLEQPGLTVLSPEERERRKVLTSEESSVSLSASEQTDLEFS